MKNLLALVLSLTILTSCHHDHDNDITIEFPTTSVVLNVSAETSTSRVSVNRNDIPATVEEIDVTITSNVSPLEVMETFELVDDGSGVDGFTVEQVALGSNDVVATTTTVANNIFNVSQFSPNNITAQEKLDANKLLVPYAIYDGEVLDYTVTGTSDFINVPMTTQNGRLNTVIIMEESIQDDYYYEVITWTASVPFAYHYPSNSSKGTSLYWSDQYAVDGEQQGITINVFDNAGTFVDEYLTVLTVAASTGINTLITINADGVQAQTVEFGFSFEPWVETGD